MTSPRNHVRERRSSPSAGEHFGGAKRYVDAQTGETVVKLFSGDCYVSKQPGEMLVTLLGSCVAACVRDPFAKVGGMNHFLLPGVEGGSDTLDGSTRYGVNAMEQLINGILKLGGHKDRLEVKLFGGGNVINQNTMIGSKNAAFVREFVAREGLRIAAEDLEGPHPRRVHYYPTSGRVMLRQLQRAEDRAIIDEESAFAKRLARAPVEGDIELF